MKLLKATIVIAGLTLSLGACKKADSNAADENAVNAAAPSAAAPDANAAAANDMDNNSAVDNEDGNGTRTDGGPRG